MDLRLKRNKESIQDCSAHLKMDNQVCAQCDVLRKQLSEKEKTILELQDNLRVIRRFTYHNPAPREEEKEVETNSSLPFESSVTQVTPPSSFSSRSKSLSSTSSSDTESCESNVPPPSSFFNHDFRLESKAGPSIKHSPSPLKLTMEPCNQNGVMIKVQQIIDKVIDNCVILY